MKIKTLFQLAGVSMLLLGAMLVQSCSHPKTRTISLTYPDSFKLVSHKGLIDGKGYADFGVQPGWVTLVFLGSHGEHKAVTFKVEENGPEIYLDLKETSLKDVFKIEH